MIILVSVCESYDLENITVLDDDDDDNDDDEVSYSCDVTVGF